MGTVNLGRVRDRVTGVERINGNGSAGTIDTYRVSFESSNYYDFNVTNGRNGVGQIVSFSGDSDSRNNLIVRIVNNQDKVLALLVKSSEQNDGYMQASFKVEKTAESTEGLATTSTYAVFAYDPTGSQLFHATCKLSNLAAVSPVVTFTSSTFEACLNAWCILYYDDSSTGITVDDELSDNSTNPVQNKVIAKFANEVVENKANVDGNYPTMTVGDADNANNLIATKGLTVNDDPMSFGIVGGVQKSAVGDGNATLNKLVCVDVVKNQLAESVSSKTDSGISYTNNDDGTYTVNGTATVTSLLEVMYITKRNHYYYYDLSGATNSVLELLGYTVTRKNRPTIVFNNMTTNPFAIRVPEGKTANNERVKPLIIDLTQRYGSNEVVNAIIGSDASTQVAKLLAFDPEILSDTDYDTGTLVPSKTAKLLSVGVNQWDEEWELGDYSTVTGEKMNGSFVRNKNPIRVNPNTIYYDKNPYASLIFFYDANMNYISYYNTGSGNTTFTTPSNACYINFRNGESYGTTYNHDICINVSDPNINGKYYPSKHTPITLPNYEGHGILKVVDGKVVADGTELYPDGNSKKRSAKYTFTGTEDWYAGSTQTSTGMYRYWLNKDLGMKPANGGIGLCNKFDNVGSNWNATTIECVFFGINDNYFFQYLSPTKKTIAELNALFDSSVEIIFPLATDEDIETPTYQSNFPVEQGGTLQFLDENDNPIAGLQGNEIFYQKNIKNFIEGLGEATDWDHDAIMFKADEMTDEELLAVQNIITGN